MRYALCMNRVFLLWLLPALVVLAGCASPGATPDHPYAEIDVELDAEHGKLHGEMRLDLPDDEPLGLTLGPGFSWSEVSLEAGRLDHRGERSVVLEPDGPTEARLTWQGQPRASGAFVRADGAWLPADSGWYPRPAPRPFGYTLTVHSPDPLQVVAEGGRGDDRVSDDQRTTTFRHPQPADGIMLVAGEWQKRSQSAQHGTIYTFFPEGLADLSDRYLERTAELFDEYAEWIGTPPHDTYSVVAAPFPVGLAFSGFTVMGERVLALPFIPETSLPHEIVHNWWGRGVYTDYSQGNWNEALTYYMGDYHQAAQRDGDEAARLRGDWLRAEQALPEGDNYPLRQFRTNRNRADEIVGYQRGAALFHALLRELGEARFTAAVQSFYAEHRHQRASWSDLQGAFEQAAGDNTDRIPELFNWFLTAQTPPRLTLDERTLDFTHTDADYRVAFDLSWDEAAYPAHIPVVLAGSDGKRKTERVSLLPGETRRIELALDERPQALKIDPEHHVYRALAVGEGVPTLRQTLLAESVTLLSDWDELAPAAQQAFRGSVQRRDEPDARPLLIVGPAEQVADQLEAIDACIARRQPPTGETPTAWATTSGRGHPVIALAADDAGDAMQALQRLERYGRHSYVAFGDGHQAEEGLYAPADRHELHVPFYDREPERPD